jgi:hypothetical protein
MSSEEEKKKFRIMGEQRVLRIHKEEFKPFWEKMAEYSRTEIDLMRGIKYGLVLGIFGNLVVQFSFALVEGMILGRYDNMVFVSLGIVLLSAFVISFVLYGFNKQRMEEQRKLEVALDGIWKEEHEIDEREVRLDAIRQGLLKENGAEVEKEKRA